MSIILGNVTGGAHETFRQIDEEDSRVRAQIRRAAQTRQTAEQRQTLQRFEQRMQQHRPGQHELPARPSVQPPAVPRSITLSPGDETTALRQRNGYPDPRQPADEPFERGAGVAAGADQSLPPRDMPDGSKLAAPVTGAALQELEPTPHAGTSLQPMRESDRPSAVAGSRQRPEQEIAPASHAAGRATTPSSLSKQIAELARSVSVPGMNLHAEQLLARLQDISGCVGDARAAADSHDEREQAKSYLEFLAGYFETERGRPGPGQKVCAAVRGLQEQMAHVEQALQTAAGLPADAISQSCAASAMRAMSSGRGKDDHAERIRNQPLAETADAAADERAVQASLALGGRPPVSADVPGCHRSSLSRDTEKRRGETLAEVTLRSV